ncbi:MAG: hypothetical protein K9N23_16795, partial [Akkermansiaceae bacterium]|nr:hypothetical protein [Akkermansiaceae bacterium]
GAAGVPRPVERLPLVFSLNGSPIGAATLTSLGGASDTASLLTPWLGAGTYTLTILHDNYRTALQLRIDSLVIRSLAGIDTDGNHSPDWLDRRLAAANRLTHIPATSLTSPLCIEGIAGPGGDPGGAASPVPGLTLTADGVPLVPVASVDSSFYANVPLAQAAPTVLTASFQSGALTETHAVTWQPADLSTLETLDIRQGDSLLLTASGGPGDGSAGTFGTYSVNLDGTLLPATQDVPNHLPEQPFPVAFDTAGTHTLAVTYHGNKPPRSVTVRVHAADFGPALSVRAYFPRDWIPASLSPDDGVQPDSRVFWEETTIDGTPRSFSVMPFEAACYRVLARLPDGISGAPSAILARGTLNAFYLAYIDETGDAQLVHTYPDGTRLMSGSLVAVGLPPDVHIRIKSFFQGSLFINGSDTLWLTAADFDQNGIAKIFFEWKGEGNPNMCTYVDIFTTDPPPAQDPPAEPSPE